MERDAEQRQRRNQKSRAERRAAQREVQSRGANAQSRQEAQRRREAEAQRPKPAEFRAKRRKRETSRNAGEKRSYIGSARARGALGDCSHANTRRDAHLVSLTRLTGAAQARGCANRACAQRRLRGAPQARGAYSARHVTKAAYTHIQVYTIKFKYL